jgi:16S rRNA G527 N7-methylase RsmG
MSADNTDHISFVLKALEGQGLGGRMDRHRLHTFLDELFRWNPRLGLVSKQDPPRIAARLIGQSVRFWDFVRSETGIDPSRGVCRVADIGTGGGFPGLIWGFLEPGLRITLIERKIRKTAFLERIVVRAVMQNVRVEGLDLSHIARAERYRHAFDLTVMMAVTHPDDVARDIDDLLTDGGFFCTIRSAAESAPPARVGDCLALLATQVTSDGCLAVYQKTST